MDSTEQMQNELARLNQKVDRVIRLLDGDGENAPGVVSRFARIEGLVIGTPSTDGLVQQFTQLKSWRLWLARTATAAAGMGATLAIQYAIKHM